MWALFRPILVIPPLALLTHKSLGRHYFTMKRAVFLIVFSLILSLVSVNPSQAASKYKLTFTYQFYIKGASTLVGSNEAGAQKLIDSLDLGEFDCETVFTYFATKTFNNKMAMWFVFDGTYIVRNEKGKIISSGESTSSYKRVGGLGSEICRASATISIPKARFYQIETNDGLVLERALPFSRFKKNKATLSLNNK